MPGGGGMGMTDGEWATPGPTASRQEGGSDATAGGGSGSSARDEPSPAVRTAGADCGGYSSSGTSSTPVLTPRPEEPCWLRQVQEGLRCGPPGQWSRDGRAGMEVVGALPLPQGSPALPAGATLPLRTGFTFDTSRVN